MESSENEFRQLNHLMSEIDCLYHEAAGKMGLSDGVMVVLYIVCENGGRCLQSAVSRLSGLSRQTVNSAIRKLAGDGTVVLEPGGGRNTVVCLTEAGERFAAARVLPLFRLENDLFAAWSPEERREYLRLTAKYRDGFKDRLAGLSPDEI